MRRRTAAALTAVTALALAACSTTSNSSGGESGSPAKADAAVSKPLTAGTAFAKLSGTVASAKLSGTVTADNDPNHLLGRPHQYTSKITFTDSRIRTSDVEGTDKGDVERGGAIEVFGDGAGAQARAEYIQAVTKSMPALSEYDYVHGAVLVRVSHYLTPTQAAEYKTAVNGLT
ncbi:MULTISPECIES: hypothetical protein [unclassified Streptomyces]|jgi:hypothetical protein|uniref:hypothetical protein n=1 Tax=unclassified Streptomyces TaxID=2593676 RepID=UPI003334651C